MPQLLIFGVLAWVFLFTAQILDEGKPASLFSHPAPIILVFGVTLMVTAAAQSFGEIGIVVKALIRAFLPKKLPPVSETIETLAELADVKRTEGLLALEKKLGDLEGDPFLQRGVGLLLDSTESDRLEDVLYGEIESLEARHKVGATFFTNAGGFAPTIGILGTVMSLVHVLENLSEPEKLGASISAAFLATFWGVCSANVMWLPVANKMKRLTVTEVQHRKIVTEGLLDIQAGLTGRAVRDKLSSALPTSARGGDEGGGKKKGKK